MIIKHQLTTKNKTTHYSPNHYVMRVLLAECHGIHFSYTIFVLFIYEILLLIILFSFWIKSIHHPLYDNIKLMLQPPSSKMTCIHHINIQVQNYTWINWFENAFYQIVNHYLKFTLFYIRFYYFNFFFSM